MYILIQWSTLKLTPLGCSNRTTSKYRIAECPQLRGFELIGYRDMMQIFIIVHCWGVSVKQDSTIHGKRTKFMDNDLCSRWHASDKFLNAFIPHAWKHVHVQVYYTSALSQYKPLYKHCHDSISMEFIVWIISQESTHFTTHVHPIVKILDLHMYTCTHFLSIDSPPGTSWKNTTKLDVSRAHAHHALQPL